MIRSTGIFLPFAAFAAMLEGKYRKRLDEGLLFLRDEAVDGEIIDLPILGEWKSARTLLQRYRNEAAKFSGGERPKLGKVWLETLPGHYGTPWRLEEDDYAQKHLRTRICIWPSPDAWTCSGAERMILAPGIVNVVEHRILHSEINLSVHPRTHLIVDVQRTGIEDLEDRDRGDSAP